MRNALIRRYASSSLRPQHLWVTLSIYVIGLGLIGLFNGLAFKSGAAFEGDIRACLRAVFGQLLAIQFLILWFWGGYGAGNALREEMLNKSYDFFRMLPLTPLQKLMGVAVGRNLLALSLAAVTAVVQLFVGLLGGVPVLLHMQIAFFLISTTAFVWCVSVLSSVRTPKSKKQNRNTSVVLLIFFSLWLLPGLMHVIVLTSSVVEVDSWSITFFGLPFPGILLVGAIFLYLALWAALGAMRQLSRSELSIFNPTGCYGFFVGCAMIVLGFVWQGLLEGETAVWFTFAAITHGLLFALPFGVLLPYEKYMALSYTLAREHGEGKVLDGAFLKRVNPFTWIKLYGIWALFVVGAACVLQSAEIILWALALVGCVFFAWAVFMLLVELAVVWKPKNEKLKFLVGFLALVYLIAPLVLAGALGKSGLMAFSFFGVWGAIGERVFEGHAADLTLLPALILNVCLVATLFMVIRKRYREILQARRSMLSGL